MPVIKNIGPGNRSYGRGVLLLLLTALICVAFTISGNEDFDTARREVLLRRIGHELLLQSGDSTSRVLPVEKIANNEYQLRFENEFSFKPEVLVNTTQRLLATDPKAGDYVVNVLNCVDAGIAYGFAVSQNKKDDIIACTGRHQPRACYTINIRFKSESNALTKTGYLAGGLSIIALVGFVFLRRNNAPEVSPARPDSPEFADPGTFQLGTMIFDPQARKLIAGDETIELTKTETRVLGIFASLPNQTIERSRLQKEIWEDEGVIVGRSLDMFISKLRKKLEADAAVNIVVIRGKGYRLEVPVNPQPSQLPG